jgi:hypothetical protein
MSIRQSKFVPEIVTASVTTQVVRFKVHSLKEFYVKSILSGGHKALPYIHSRKIRRGGVYPRPIWATEVAPTQIS